jgi:energy-coupling factor transporter transmembrane protein EcfT
VSRLGRGAGADLEREPAVYRAPQINLMREVKIDSPVHRLWAGTKLVIVGALSVTLSYFPTWTSLGAAAVLLLLAILLGRIPSGAWPRPPRWFWIVLLISGGLTTAAGGKPHVHVFGVLLGLGGIDSWARFVGVGMLLLIAALVLGWTTPLGEIAPAVARLLWPLRLVRVPVDEAAITIALCVRSLPLLLGEMRTLLAARRLRPTPERVGASELERALDMVVDIMVAALAVSVRRGGELAEAISARGGTGMFAARTRRPGWGDLVAIMLTAGVCVAATTLP